MDFILQFDLNFFAIFLLVSLIIVIKSKQELPTIKSNLFLWLIITTILMLFVEVLSWKYDGEPGRTNYIFNNIFNFLFTGFSVVAVSLWISYIDYTIYEDKKRLIKRWFYCQPSLIILVLSIINFFYPILFVITDENVYSRLPLVVISLVFTGVIYLYGMYMVIINRKRLNNNVLYGVLVFLLLPISAAVLQLSFYGLLLIWPATAVALMFSYLIFETTSSSRDYLTGAYLRMRAEEFIKTLIKKHKKFAVVMIDLDDFKGVNDTFGHHVGDAMLVEITTTLKTVFNDKSVISRYGGDEFLIVIEGANFEDMELYRKQIQQSLRNSNNLYARAQKFSYGVAFCEKVEDLTMDSIITIADDNMYLDKAKNKNNKRRKSDY